jgi:hypothetical protein
MFSSCDAFIGELVAASERFLGHVAAGASPLHFVAHFTFSPDNSATITHALRSSRICAMGAAVKGSIGLDTMPNNPAAAMLASRGKSGNGAFKAVEHMRPTSHEHLKGLIVLVTAHFTLCHAHHPLSLTRPEHTLSFTRSWSLVYPQIIIFLWHDLSTHCLSH